MASKFLLLLCVLVCGTSLADRIFIIDKQEEKAKNRWSLAEYLEQRDRIRLMDLWLALHSPSPYEFYLSGEYQTGHYPDYSNLSVWKLSFAAYASVFGLGLEHEFQDNARTFGLFHLRVFGFHDQGTNLTLMAGVKNESRGGASDWNPLVGASLNFYFSRFIGIESLYHHYFSYPAHGLATSGDRFEAGGFIDYSFVRIYTDYFVEVEVGNSALSRRGVLLGVKAFF